MSSLSKTACPKTRRGVGAKGVPVSEVHVLKHCPPSLTNTDTIVSLGYEQMLRRCLGAFMRRPTRRKGEGLTDEQPKGSTYHIYIVLTYRPQSTDVGALVRASCILYQYLDPLARWLPSVGLQGDTVGTRNPA